MRDECWTRELAVMMPSVVLMEFVIQRFHMKPFAQGGLDVTLALHSKYFDVDRIAGARAYGGAPPSGWSGGGGPGARVAV